ncbi:hypothetical protein [Shewanella sp. NIFS-20-20]|uniref:hypothetical protein n=1 Tax=Shewanella sp. NIFS-20-20 TaxID=2853806 RepID=UPI001C445025|nr:hypothetical protein [Shewanella sp. NIFS-20-20]MBV7316568.1 hypothetical protein [Shewanella sp. NIFS-20-20]
MNTPVHGESATDWQHLYVFGITRLPMIQRFNSLVCDASGVACNQPALLVDVAKGDANALLPSEAIAPLFVDHCHWPPTLLSQYCLNIEGYQGFILPISVASGSHYHLDFGQSMKAPDGSVEILAVGQCDGQQPADWLAHIQATLAFIKQHRGDITRQSH